ncbi:MAG: 2-phosphosulfolactate phosphatase [Rhodocyclaceae bacterium]|nr:2-phosphosulfolactate phosphatase [Rhodocyclaceae bacterium]
MHFERHFLNREPPPPAAGDTVVVIDVLRSFTTVAVALANGASVVYPVLALDEAQSLGHEIDKSITIGAVVGGAPAPGFDVGNSPATLNTIALNGRPVILSTAGGVQGLHRYREQSSLYAASLVCARATAHAIARSNVQRVCFVITGEWADRDGDEDLACADYIEALLCGEPVHPAPFTERVWCSDFGRRFQTGTWPHLPLDDLRLCAAVDQYDFAMPVRRHGAGLVIHAATEPP